MLESLEMLDLVFGVLGLGLLLLVSEGPSGASPRPRYELSSTDVLSVARASKAALLTRKR